MIKKMALVDFLPESKLEVKETIIKKPKFPLIDGHNHLRLLGDYWMDRPVEDLLAMMNEANVQAIVDLDGMRGEDILLAHMENSKQKHPIVSTTWVA